MTTPNSDKALGAPTPASEQLFAANYDEALVGNLPIPDVLRCEDGTEVTDKQQWEQKRRPELLGLFAREMFGKTVVPRKILSVEQRGSFEILDGLGRVTQVALRYGAKADQVAQLMYVLPQKATQPVPMFVALGFGGNQTTMHDPRAHMQEGWAFGSEANGFIEHRATEASRGVLERRWPFEAILKRGYGVAIAYYGDFDPDYDDGFQNGVHPLGYRNGATAPAEDEWGAIGAWSWGLSLLADYLVTLPQVDAKRLIVQGHSRLGKAALWAGVQDSRFAIVISNNSGCGGAALSRRNFGETVARINNQFPHWFCPNFRKYSNNEAALPFDQHAMIALVAPRPVYIASATEDLWADPKGEFLSGKLAEPVYALYGKAGLGTDAPPAPDAQTGDAIGYHSRTGKHDVLRFDWERYMDFADQHFGKPAQG